MLITELANSLSIQFLHPHGQVSPFPQELLFSSAGLLEQLKLNDYQHFKLDQEY